MVWGRGKRGLGGQPKANSVDNACYFHAENTKGSPDLVTVAGSRRILSKITWKLKPKAEGVGMVGGWKWWGWQWMDGWQKLGCWVTVFTGKWEQISPHTR